MTSYWWRHMLINNHKNGSQVCARVIEKMISSFFHGPHNWKHKSNDVIIYDVILSKIFLFAIVAENDKQKFLLKFKQCTVQFI